MCADCQDLLRKVIEPSPELRLPLLDMEVHPWVTNNGKLPFFPFQAFPRDKALRSQVRLHSPVRHRAHSPTLTHAEAELTEL